MIRFASILANSEKKGRDKNHSIYDWGFLGSTNTRTQRAWSDRNNPESRTYFIADCHSWEAQIGGVVDGPLQRRQQRSQDKPDIRQW